MSEHLENAGARDGPRVGSGKVLVTGGSGFVGRYVVRELLSGGYEPVCLVRSQEKMLGLLNADERSRTTCIRGDVLDPASLREAARSCVAAIHLVGIIEEHPSRGQTFERMHVDATRAVVQACEAVGIRRYVHMSALGSRPGAVSVYHQTKWRAEEIVRAGTLAWTILRPSVIHGPDAEFIQMMKFFSTNVLRQPVMPYFGSGDAQLQPVSVLDVGTCFVRALRLPETIGQVYEVGGPERLTWKEMYDACAVAFTGHTRLKMPVPVSLAKLLAVTVMPIAPSALVPYRFNVDQVQMSQEDSICDIGPVERTFDIKMRDFRRTLSSYAGQVR